MMKNLLILLLTLMVSATAGAQEQYLGEDGKLWEKDDGGALSWRSDQLPEAQVAGAEDGAVGWTVYLKVNDTNLFDVRFAYGWKDSEGYINGDWQDCLGGRLRVAFAGSAQKLHVTCPRTHRPRGTYPNLTIIWTTAQ